MLVPLRAVAAGGTANITLSGKNILSSGYSRAGLEVPVNAKVTINGRGSLDVTGGGGAGIGGGAAGDGGNITISGAAEVKAQGGAGSGGIITISGNVEVTATGDSGGGAGIGGGGGGSGGIITISGNAEVTATGGSGSAGIGGGYGIGGGSAGAITIDGNPVVFAKGGRGGGNPIGSSKDSSNTDKPKLTQGVVFEGETGTVYGSPTLPGDVTIPQTIP